MKMTKPKSKFWEYVQFYSDRFDKTHKKFNQRI